MNKMKLSTRLYASFLIILLLLVGIVGYEILTLQNISSRKDRMFIATKINEGTAYLRQYSLEYFETEEDETAANVETYYNSTIEELNEGLEVYKNTEYEETIANIETEIIAYYESFLTYKTYAESKASYRDDMLDATDTILADLEEISGSRETSFSEYIDSIWVMDAEEVSLWTIGWDLEDDFEAVISARESTYLMNTIAIAQLRYFLLGLDEYDLVVSENIETINTEYATLYSTLEDDTEKELVVAAIQDIGVFEDAYEAYKELVLNQETEKETMSTLAEDITLTTSALAEEQETKMESMVTSAESLAISIGVMSVIIGLLFAMLITRSLVKNLTTNMNKLTKSSKRVANASTQLTEASQQLSEGSTEQAASIEETSATMEETASMVQQNAQNTREANDLSKQASKAAEDGSQRMHNMSLSMDELKQSSADISKIIKVINDIAFQTNMLALNAAVEAARAGDAGLGFAVVADEVRNLAQKSAEAANNTEEIIARNIELSEQGVKLGEEVNLAFDEIINKTNDVNRLIDEIALASEEQARGTMQVTDAIGQMEKVVQQNAATAEESAASAEELQAQAKTLAVVVKQLEYLVKGTKGNAKSTSGKKKDKKIKKESFLKKIKENIQKKREEKAKLAEEALEEIDLEEPDLLEEADASEEFDSLEDDLDDDFDGNKRKKSKKKSSRKNIVTPEDVIALDGDDDF